MVGKASIDIEAVRRDTPGCTERIHLNNAGAGLMPDVVSKSIIEHVRLETEIGGYEASDARAAEIEEGYGDIATLVNAAPRNIAIVANATAGFVQALSAINLQRGDVILTSRSDYTSNQIQYLALKRLQGITVRYAEDLEEGGVDPDSVRRILKQERCKLVALTWVPSYSGLVQDVESVGQVCREVDVPFLVDACQAAGQVPIDTQSLGCDYLSVTARKFLRGPRGIGFLYASDRALERGDFPLFVDMRGARWVAPDSFEIAPTARRFEDWEFPYALVLGQGAAVRYALEIGVEAAQARAWQLASYARDCLRKLPGVRVLDRGRRQCAIVTFAAAGWHARDLLAALYVRGINTTALLHEYAQFDFQEKGVESALRVSPHYYNTEGEIEIFAEALAELLRSSSMPDRARG